MGTPPPSGDTMGRTAGALPCSGHDRRGAPVTDTVARPETPPAGPQPPVPAPPVRRRPALSAWADDGAHRMLRRVLAWPSWVQVLAAYGASRLLSAVIIELAAQWGQNPAGVGVLHPHYLDMVRIWDGEWYQRIAEHGYPDGLPHGRNGVDYNAWAFFPVFPLLVRAVMVTGLSFSLAASLLNLVAGAGAALVIWKLFSVRPGHDRLAVLAVALWCVLP